MNRNDIIATLSTELMKIKKADGYLTNLGDNVYVWKSDDWSPDQMTGVDIRDNKIVQNTASAYIGVWDWELIIDLIVVADGSGARNEIQKAIEDILKVLGANQNLSGNCILVKQPYEIEFEQVTDEHKYCAAKIVLGIIYRSNQYEI